MQCRRQHEGDVFRRLHKLSGRPEVTPGARSAALHDTRTGRRVATLVEREGTGFFEALLARRRNPFDYRLNVRWSDGHEGLQGDPYRYGPLIGEQDLYYLGEGSHLRPFEILGAHPMTLGDGAYAIDGVRVVGFDNERGKGDHCHVRGVERRYTFVSVERLIEDFIAAVDAARNKR